MAIIKPASLISTHGSLSSWLLDEHLLVAEFFHRHFRVYNASAATLWLLLSDNLLDQSELVRAYAGEFDLPVDMAERDITLCLTEWQSLGWLALDQDGRFRIGPQCLPDQSSTATTNPVALPGHTKIYEAIFQFGDTDFGVRIGETFPMGSSGLAARIVAMLQGFPISAVTGSRQWLDVVVAQDATYLNDGVSPVSVRSDSADALSQLIQSLFRLAYPQSSILSTLHAAAVGKNGALLLSGVSGAGKSTLAAQLAAKGWHYYGDDIVGLGAGGEVLPLPTAVSLKEGSWSVLRDIFPTLDTMGTIEYGAKIARYLPLSCEIATDTGARLLAAWVFPVYRDGSLTQFEAIDTIEAVQLLISGGMALSEHIDQEGMKLLLDMLTRLPKYRLVYSNVDEAEACLLNLLPD